MSSVNGVNAALQALSQPAPAGEVGGRPHIIMEKYVFPADAFASGDKILGPKIPKGARVIDAYLHIPASLGTTGQFTLGHLASADAVESASADAFASACDGGGQAALTRAVAAQAGLKVFAADVQLVITSTEITTAALGLGIQAVVEYIMD